MTMGSMVLQSELSDVSGGSHILVFVCQRPHRSRSYGWHSAHAALQSNDVSGHFETDATVLCLTWLAMAAAILDRDVSQVTEKVATEVDPRSGYL